MFPKILNFNWQFIFLCILAFLIPYGINYWPYLIIWLFLWLNSGDYKSFEFLKEKSLWIFAGFYFLHLIGILYSRNKEYAIEIAQSEIGFFLFPLFMNNYTLTKDLFNKILHVFCFSNVLLAAYLILRALHHSVIANAPIYTYSRFSYFIHPSYCSLYMIFSIAALYLGGFQLYESPKKDMIAKLTFTAVLLTAVLFCSSKIGLISLVAIILFLAVYFIVKLRSVYYAFLFLISLSVTCFVLVKTIPAPLQRLNNVLVDYKNTKGMTYNDLQAFNKQTIDKGLNQHESVLARIFIWGSAWTVIKQNFFFGVGPSDVSDAMNASAQTKGIIAFKNYNMHNQYIETQMGLGLPGLLILVILTVGILIYAFIKKDLLFIIFSILVILCCCVESVFRMDYFSFFFSIFAYMFIKVNSPGLPGATC